MRRSLGGRPDRGPRDVEVALLVAAPAALVLARASTLAGIGRAAGTCWIHATLGLPCPTCGVTRAAIALAHGDWHAAFFVQPLVTALVVLAALYVPWAIGVVGLGWKPLRIELRGRSRRPLRWALVGIVLANWGYLIHAGV